MTSWHAFTLGRLVCTASRQKPALHKAALPCWHVYPIALCSLASMRRATVAVPHSWLARSSLQSPAPSRRASLWALHLTCATDRPTGHGSAAPHPRHHGTPGVLCYANTLLCLCQDKSVGLRCLTSSPDGRVFAGFHSGHLKCYSGLGRLVWKKVSLLSPLLSTSSIQA